MLVQLYMQCKETSAVQRWPSVQQLENLGPGGASPLRSLPRLDINLSVLCLTASKDCVYKE